MSGSGAGARRTSGRAGSWAARRLHAGRAGRARQAGLSGRGAAGHAAGRAGARGRQARWARPAWAWPGRSLCARAGPAGPGWGFVHSDSVFFGPVRLGSFPSHQMNTVHGEIKFFEKKKIYFKKIK